MIISCKESRIENNKRFYGCFYLGDFSSDSGQRLTVANALRRSLLSDCTGLAIIAVQIDNVVHEFSTLSGVKESVLDITLSLKEILFKKIKNPLTGVHGYKQKGISSLYEQAGSSFFKPVVAYLKVKGPGVIRAKDLRLPPFLQCVDPSQYIATLAEDGVLNLKCVIMEGKGYSLQNGRHEKTFSHNYESSHWPSTRAREMTNQFLQNPRKREIDLKRSSHSESFFDSKKSMLEPEEVKILKKEREERKTETVLETLSPKDDQIPEEAFSQTLKQKRHNLVKDLKKILNLGKDECISTPSPSPAPSDSEEGLYTPKAFTQEKEFLFSNQKPLFEKKEKLSSLTPKRRKTLTLDAVFNPVTKVNYIIEGIDNSLVAQSYENLKAIENLTSFLDSSLFLKTHFPSFHPIGEEIQKHILRKEREEREEREENALSREEKMRAKTKAVARDCFHYITSLSNAELKSLCTSEGKSHYKGIGLENSANSFSPQSHSADAEPVHSPPPRSPHNDQGQTGFEPNAFESKESRSRPPDVFFLKRQIILLEIWTNGSIHPREALTMAFKNLASPFHIDQIKIANPFFHFSTSYQKRRER